jgi:SAM-dependent methyltransferase
MNDPTQDFYNTHADAYVANTDANPPMEWREKFAAKVIKNGRVLDLGCAAGRDSAYFDKCGFSVVGVDFAETMIAKARARVSNALFLQQDVRQLSVEGPFDGIYADSVLLHLPKIEIPDVLKQFPPLLASGAPVFIAMKSGQGEGMEADTRYDGALKFYAYITRDELESWLKDSGLVIDEIEEHQSPLQYQTSGLIKALTHKA